MTIAIGKNQEVYAILETNTGENEALLTRRAVPSAADDATFCKILAAGEVSMNQELELLDDEQRRGGRSRLDKIGGRFNPGTFTIPTYMKTGGVNGSSKLKVPEVDALLVSLIGDRTPVDAVSAVDTIQYSIGATNPSFTLWFKNDHTVLCGIGATVNKGKFDINGNDIGKANFEGEFMQMLRGGTATLNTTLTSGVATTTVVLAAGHGDRFDPGMFIKIGTDDNTKAGYEIDSIVADTLTLVAAITPAADIAANSVVKGYIPYSDDATYVAEPERGSAVHGKAGVVTINGTDIIVTESMIEITNGIGYSVDEKNGSMYAKDYFNSAFREVTGSITLYFREDQAKFWKASWDRIAYALLIPLGDVDTNTIELACPKIKLVAPTTSGDAEIKMTFTFDAFLSAAQGDEFTYTLT